MSFVDDIEEEKYFLDWQEQEGRLISAVDRVVEIKDLPDELFLKSILDDSKPVEYEGSFPAYKVANQKLQEFYASKSPMGKYYKPLTKKQHDALLNTYIAVRFNVSKEDWQYELRIKEYKDKVFSNDNNGFDDNINSNNNIKSNKDSPIFDSDAVLKEILG